MISYNMNYIIYSIYFITFDIEDVIFKYKHSETRINS